MSYSIVWWKDEADGKIRRSYKIHEYDAEKQVFRIIDPAATSEHIKNRMPPYVEADFPNIKPVCFELPLAKVLFCNWEAREHHKLFNVPCQVTGYGADLKAFLLMEELKTERSAGAPKSAGYVKWRDQFIADVEAGPSREQIQAAYPKVPMRPPSPNPENPTT